MPEITMFICNPMDFFMAQMKWESERAEMEWEHEQDLKIEQELGRWPSMEPETEEADIEYVDAVFCLE